MTLELAQPAAGDLDLSLHLETAMEPEREDELWCYDYETNAQWEHFDNLQQAAASCSKLQQAEDVTRSRTPMNP